MTTLEESWKRTTEDLHRAAQILGSEGLATFHEYLDHNELELAADVLFDVADERCDVPRAFWEALALAFENMTLDVRAARCRAKAALETRG